MFNCIEAQVVKLESPKVVLKNDCPDVLFEKILKALLEDLSSYRSYNVDNAFQGLRL